MYRNEESNFCCHLKENGGSIFLGSLYDVMMLEIPLWKQFKSPNYMHSSLFSLGRVSV
jgi:hypothetical protein